jgi:hypothetical protein
MSELQLLKNFAATARRGGFGSPGFKLDGTTGEYRRLGDKTGAKMNGQRLAATVADIMIGYQRIEKGKSPTYIVGRVSDGFTPPPREELGDLDHEKDPWTLASWVPFWNPDSREVLLFHAANDGSRDAVANLVQAYVDNREAHPDQADYDPLIELGADHYDGQHRRIFYPLFDIVDWIERPVAVRRVLPAPMKLLELTAMPASPPTTPPKLEQSAATVAKSKPKTPVTSEMDDDEIPY